MRNPDQPITVLMTIDRRCRNCLVPRLIARAIEGWDEEDHGTALGDGLEEFVERRCRDCLDSVYAEVTSHGYQLFIAARE